jgi:hypothetical protein
LLFAHQVGSGGAVWLHEQSASAGRHARPTNQSIGIKLKSINKWPARPRDRPNYQANIWIINDAPARRERVSNSDRRRRPTTARAICLPKRKTWNSRGCRPWLLNVAAVALSSGQRVERLAADFEHHHHHGGGDARTRGRFVMIPMIWRRAVQRATEQHPLWFLTGATRQPETSTIDPRRRQYVIEPLPVGRKRSLDMPEILTVESPRQTQDDLLGRVSSFVRGARPEKALLWSSFRVSGARAPVDRVRPSLST